MRLPAEELRPFVPAILEGILLWAEDSKNKFRLKVRVIMERLARRCGFEALEASVPESHRPLLTHIRKEAARRERKGREGQSEMDWEGAEEEDTKSRASRWASDVFSDDSGGEEGRGRASEGGRTARTAKTAGARTQGGKTARSGGTAAGGGAGGAGRRLPSGGDPLDLLDASTSRRLVRAAGKAGARPAGRGRGEEGDDGPEFGRGEGGRMVIREEEGEGGGKRKRAAGEDHGMDSGDSDFEDLKGFSGLELALRGSKSVAQAPSIAASLGGRSRGARTEGGRSRGGRTEGGRSRDGRTEGGRSAPGDRRGAQHSGDRFKAKGKGAAGDVKGGSRVEPYAYWPLDRKLLNRRAQKTRSAKQGLDRIVTAAKEGAARGSKAKKRARKA
jgi:ribosomal RNA-processing protein 12